MMRRRLGTAATLALPALAAVAALGSQTAMKALLPKSGQVSGWSVYADTYQYCASADELHEIYDGGDQEWIDAGVVEAVQQAYKSGDRIMTVTIHRMKSWERAKALYKKKDAGIKQQTGYENPKIQAAHSLCRANGVTTGYGWRKTYFVTYTLSTAGTSGAATTKAFMKVVAGKIR